jgi:hypothetical protein
MSRKLIDSLKPVASGQDLLDVLTAARINTIQDLLKALWLGNNLAPGKNVTISRGDNQVTIASAAAAGTGGSLPATTTPDLFLVSKADGTARWAALQASAICNTDGTITFTIGPEPE